MSDDGPPVLAYRTDEVGLGLLLLWLRETPGATLGDATATGILEGWLTLFGDTPGAVPDPEDAHLEVTQLKARVRALEAALRALTAVEPTLHVPQDYEDCVYCPASKPVYGPRWNDPFVHDPDCPWIRARALLPEAP